MKRIILLLHFFISTYSFAVVESDYLSTVALQSDGKIVTAGNATIDGVTQFGLFRLTTAGALDTTFGGTGIVNTIIGSSSEVSSIKIQADTKIVAVGFAVVSGATRVALARYNTNGTLDTTFGASLTGIVTEIVGDAATASSIQIDATNKLVVGGITNQSGISKFFVMRYNTDGTLDNTFGTNGLVITQVGMQVTSTGDLAIQSSDGKIVIGGSSSDGVTNEQFTLVRYNTDGSLDTSFGTNGVVVTPIGAISRIKSIKIQADGQIVAGGLTNIESDFVVARYNSADGSLDTSFNTDGIFSASLNSGDEIHSIAIQSADQKIVMGGIAGDFFALGRLNTDGTLDNTFGSGGVVTDMLHLSAGINDIAIQTDGKIVVAGFDDNRAALARFTTVGVVDSTFGNNGVINSPAPPVTLDGQILFSSFDMTKDAVASPETKFSDVYTTSGLLFPIRVWSLHPSGSTQEAITLLFNIPADFDTILPLQVELHLMIDNKAAAGTNAALLVRADFKGNNAQFGAAAGGAEQSITSSTITFTEPTGNNLKHVMVTVPLNNTGIFPGDFAFMAFTRAAPTGTEYNADIYLSSVSFRYKKVVEEQI